MRTSILAAAALALVSSSASAAIVTYTNQANFTAAAGPLTLQDFNSFATEASFRSSPVVAGDLTLQGYGAQQDRNFIDIPPYQFGVFNIDGTTNVNAFTTQGGGFTITFAHSVTAFGATFAAFQDSMLRSQIHVLSDVLTPPIQSGDVVAFFGFVSDTPFDTITFTGNGNNDGFSFDNALSSSGAVPEPATWAMMIAGFGMAGLALRRRRCAAALG